MTITLRPNKFNEWAVFNGTRKITKNFQSITEAYGVFKVYIKNNNLKQISGYKAEAL